jgi:osmotically-inducible protein OsmY
MKTRIAVAVASLFAVSLGTAYAQTPQQATPQTPPQQTMPQQQPASPMTSASMTSNDNASQIEQKVKRELTSHGVTATGVTVSFNDGTATLSGTVYNQRDITKATDAAMRVRGVKHVDTSNLHARKSASKHGQG